METLQTHGGVGPERDTRSVLGVGGVPRFLEARWRLRDGLHRLRSRVGHPDDRGVSLLLQLVGGLGGGAGVDDDPGGVVVGRVDRKGLLRLHDVRLR